MERPILTIPPKARWRRGCSKIWFGAVVVRRIPAGKPTTVARIVPEPTIIRVSKVASQSIESIA
jgi:hypothetical protein